MIHRAIAQLRKIGLLDDLKAADWTPIQFWKIVSLLSKHTEVSFDDLVVHPLFKSDPRPLLQMERAGLITCIHSNGRPFSIRPGRPLFYKAFQEMVSDVKLNAFMNLVTAKQLYKDYSAKLKELEVELQILNDTGDRGGWIVASGVDSRRKWLNGAIGLYSKKVQGYFDDQVRLKKQLKLSE